MSVENAFQLLRDRLAKIGAELNPQSFQNGQIMKAYVDSQGLDIATLSDAALAEALYQAVNAEAEKMSWVKKPARLKKHAENEKNRNQTTAQHDLDAFNQKLKAAEASKAKEDSDNAARRLINTAINSLHLNLAWQTEDYRKRLNAFVGNQVRMGVSLQDAATSVTQLVAEIHSADEAVSEIVGGTRSIASILEKRGVQI